MTIKNKILENFNRAALTYNSVASIQKKTAQQLLDYLQMTSIPFSKVLDIGTGTGFIPEMLLLQNPNLSLILNDLSPEMLKYVREKFSNYSAIDYHLGDAEQEVFPKVDAIISNMAFQWFENLQQSLNSLWKKTNILAFSTLIEGTFSQWTQRCDSLGFNHGVHDYPSFIELVKYCNGLCPHKAYFYEYTYTLPFKTPLEFVRYLKLLGANTPRHNDPSYLKKALYKLPDGTSANYNVFYAVLIKSISI